MSQCCVDDELIRARLQPFVLTQVWEKKIEFIVGYHDS